MKQRLIFLLLITTLSLSMAQAKDCVNKQQVKVDLVDEEMFDDISFYLGYEEVDWTAYNGKKIILKLHTRAFVKNNDPSSMDEYQTRYVISQIDFNSSLSENGIEYSYLDFTPISKQEAISLNQNDGIKVIKKVVNYAQFSLNRDIPLSQKIYASFQPVHTNATIAYPINNNLQLELSAGTGVGYSYTESTNYDYKPVSNFYADVEMGFKVKHKRYGTFSFDYDLISGVVMQNIRPGNYQGTSRLGRVRATYTFDLSKSSNCELYLEKRSYQINPGYNEEENTKQERLYKKAKTLGAGCQFYLR